MNEGSVLLVQFTIAMGIVLVLIIGLAWLYKKINRVSSRIGRNGAEPRLAVSEALAVDHKRRLILIKRDQTEHLLLIGGENDVLIEHHIPNVPISHHVQQPGVTASPQPQSSPQMPIPNPASPPARAPAQMAPRPTPAAQAPQQPALTGQPAPSAQQRAASHTPSALQRGQQGIKAATSNVASASAASGAGAAAAIGAAGNRLSDKTAEQPSSEAKPDASQAEVLQAKAPTFEPAAPSSPVLANWSTAQTLEQTKPAKPTQPEQADKAKETGGKDEGSKQEKAKKSQKESQPEAVTPAKMLDETKAVQKAEQPAQKDPAVAPAPDLATAVRRPRPSGPEHPRARQPDTGNADPDMKAANSKPAETSSKSEKPEQSAPTGQAAPQPKSRRHLSESEAYDDEINRLLNELTQDSSK